MFPTLAFSCHHFLFLVSLLHDAAVSSDFSYMLLKTTRIVPTAQTLHSFLVDDTEFAAIYQKEIERTGKARRTDSIESLLTLHSVHRYIPILLRKLHFFLLFWMCLSNRTTFFLNITPDTHVRIFLRLTKLNNTFSFYIFRMWWEIKNQIPVQDQDQDQDHDFTLDFNTRPTFHT